MICIGLILDGTIKIEKLLEMEQHVVKKIE